MFVEPSSYFAQKSCRKQNEGGLKGTGRKNETIGSTRRRWPPRRAKFRFAPVPYVRTLVLRIELDFRIASDTCLR